MTSVTTHFKKLTTGNNMFIVSVIVYIFLLVFNSNFYPILHCFRDTAA